MLSASLRTLDEILRACPLAAPAVMLVLMLAWFAWAWWHEGP